MERTETCRICGKAVTSTDIYGLGEHLLKEHPQQDFTFFTAKTGTSNTSSQIAAGKKAARGFKTTVESWQPSADPMVCPQCGSKKNPFIRKQRHKVARSSIGASLLLACWPLCFMPMLLGKHGAITTINCRDCGHCYGVYDPVSGKLAPPAKVCPC